jgi:hypothetical protein
VAGKVQKGNQIRYPLVDVKQLLAGAVERRRQPLVDQVQVVVRCVGIVCRRILQPNMRGMSCMWCRCCASKLAALVLQCRRDYRGKIVILSRQWPKFQSIHHLQLLQQGARCHGGLAAAAPHQLRHAATPRRRLILCISSMYISQRRKQASRLPWDRMEAEW